MTVLPLCSSGQQTQCSGFPPYGCWDLGVEMGVWAPGIHSPSEMPQEADAPQQLSCRWQGGAPSCSGTQGPHQIVHPGSATAKGSQPVFWG